MLFIYKKNRNISFLYIILFLIIWFIFGLNINNPDYVGYENIYNSVTTSISSTYAEKGFIFLCYIANYLGLTYQSFLMIYSLFGLMLISFVLFEMALSPTYVLLLYAIFPFLFDVVQIRSFMAFAICIYATNYLHKFSIANFIKFCFAIIIAASQHIIALVFFVYLFVYVKSTKKLLLYLMIITLLLCYFIKHVSIGSVSNILLYFREFRDISIFTKSMDFFRLLRYFILFSFAEFLVIYSHLLIMNADDKTKNVLSKEINYHHLYKICIITFIFFFLLFLDSSYFRIFRSLLLIFYIVITNNISIIAKKYYCNKLLLFITLLLYVVFAFYYLLGPNGGYFMDITYPIIRENPIVSYLLD